MKFIPLLLFIFFFTYSCASDDFELEEQPITSEKIMQKDSIQQPSLNNLNEDCETIWNCSKTE